MFNIRNLVVPALLAGLLLAATAEAQRFVFINRGDVATLDPNRMSWLQDIRVGYGLWEGLYRLDPQTLQPVPGAAERIEISEDRTVYTFHLRENGRWTNGDPVVAGDFVFAWRRMLEEPGDYTYLLHYIRGARQYEEAFGEGQGPDFAQTVGVEVVDPRTLRVTLEHPVPFFPDICAFPTMFPLHEASMRPFRQTAGGRTFYRPEFTHPPHLVGNGPFRLASWEPRRGLRLEASQHYWDRANVRSQVIEVISAADPMAAFQRYEQGDVHWLAEVAGSIAADLRQRNRPDLHIFPGFGTYFYTVNCQEKLPDGRDNPFADVRVRQAFAHAIRKDVIVRDITRLGEPVATTYIPPGIFEGYNSPEGLGFNVGEARRLLAEAGYPQGRGFPRITLLYNTEGGQHEQIAQIVRRQIQAVLGVTLELEGVEIQQFRQRLHNKQYELARASWIGDYGDPSTFTDKYRSTSLNNDSGWINEEYDRLCAAAAREADPQQRLRLLEQAEAILLREVPIIPVYHYVNAYLFRDNVRGVPLHPRNMVMLQALHAE